MIAKSTKASGALVNYDHMEGREGFEPSTPGLKVRSSTAELTAPYRAI